MKTRLLTALFLATLVMVLPVESRSQDALVVERGRSIRSFGEVRQRIIELIPREEGTGEVIWSEIDLPSVPAFRLHFNVTSQGGDPNWEMNIYDSTGKRIPTVMANAKRETEFWSDIISGRKATIKIATKEPETTLRLHIDYIAVFGSMVRDEAVTDKKDDRKPITDPTNPPQFRAWGQSVARILFVAENDKRQYYCTGFLVSKDILMTNEHCIKTDYEAKSAVVQFDYDTARAKPVEIRGKELIACDYESDFSLLRLVAPSDRPPLKLRVDSQSPKRELLIIQHPGGDPKMVSRVDCEVLHPTITGRSPRGVAPRGVDFSHRCDTSVGSSGSPAIDLNTGFVVGLHHLGFRENDKNPVNQAVKIEVIKAYLTENRRQDILAEIGLQ